MDCLVRVFYGGNVRDNGEFDNMTEDVEMFDSPPTYVALRARTWKLLGCQVGPKEIKF